jgi:hypothetical protein
MRPIRILIILGALLALLPSPCCAADSTPEPRYSWLDPYGYVHYAFEAGRGVVRSVRQIEALELLTAIATG